VYKNGILFFLFQIKIVTNGKRDFFLKIKTIDMQKKMKSENKRVGKKVGLQPNDVFFLKKD